MSRRRRPNRYQGGHQLSLFVDSQHPTNPTIRNLLTEQAEIDRMIGTDVDWLSKTLSEVLTLWDNLVERFVMPWETKITEAKRGKAPKQELELLQLKSALHLLLITNPFTARMDVFEAAVQDRARSLGIAEDELCYVSDLVHFFFHQPVADELRMTLAQAVETLASELID